jgi:hypothetical protein
MKRPGFIRALIADFLAAVSLFVILYMTLLSGHVLGA